MNGNRKEVLQVVGTVQCVTINGMKNATRLKNKNHGFQKQMILHDRKVIISLIPTGKPVGLPDNP